MSPRPGGEAEKLGNHYEGAWIAWQLLEVLAGRAQSVTIEELGEIGEGVEFTLRRLHVTEVHQVKRQRGSANYWHLGDLRSEGVLEAAHRHVADGREFHFVSTIPAQELQDLAEQARHSPNLETFVHTLRGKNVQLFDYLSGVYESSKVAWKTLQGTWARWPGERDVRNWSAAMAGQLIAGAPAPTAAVILADLAVENMSRPLDKQAISEQLAAYELALATTGASRPLSEALSDLHGSWKASVERELLNPPIGRIEVDQVAERLFGADRCVLAVGASGVGKSAVLHGVVKRAESQGWAVLAFRLDREAPFSSTTELGERFRLEMSPVSALARMAQGRPSLLVVDQLDAVSKASGRMPQSFDAVADLVREAAAFSDMRVLLACRKFDVDNDDRIRTLNHDHEVMQVEVAELSDEQVATTVQSMGIASDRLTRRQLAVLRIPLHLKLLSTIADQAEPFSFTTPRALFDAYWERKRRDCRVQRGESVRFPEVVRVIADEMSTRQRLTVPVSVLDKMHLADDADVLASQHVLVRDGQQLAFFHESFFDYAFARAWTQRSRSLVDFLLEGGQELFRRAQVRQILAYIRDDQPERFVMETERLLVEPRVRFHIKQVALNFLNALEAPTTAEWEMVERVLAEQPMWADQLLIALRTTVWFDRLQAEGVLDAWLRDHDERVQKRALDVMVGSVNERPDQIAALLAPYSGRIEQYPAWLRWITRFAQVHQSRALFDLTLSAVSRGDYEADEHELFMSVYDLGIHQPTWAVELLVAYLLDRPGALMLDASRRIPALLSHDYGAIELAITAASGAPVLFSTKLVPYMLQVTRLTEENPGRLPIRDRHFTQHIDFPDHEPPYQELEEALIVAAADALRNTAQQHPDDAKPLLDELAADPHAAAQWLLYEALTAGGATYAGQAAALLVERENGLSAADSWTVRRVIEAISSHISNDLFTQLERAVLDFHPSWEGRPGSATFRFLSAMDEARLSATARRQLGELRGLFEADQPTQPPRITSGFIRSPISQEIAAQMTDDEWLRAMGEHNTDQENWDTFTGGARELSHVLKEEVAKSPGRFAQLALRFDRDMHAAYTEAILMGLGDTTVSVDSNLVFEAIRHIAALNIEDNDRWLGWALRPHLTGGIPEDLISLLVERAINAHDPGDAISEDFADDSERRDTLLEKGINTARGQLVERLGDIVLYDADGLRTAVVAPMLEQLAGDASLAVRACTAHLIAACLRHARPVAVKAFQRLIEADDRLLVSRHTESLIVYVGNSDVETVKPVIERMLASTHKTVREAGGRLAGYAGLVLESEELLTAARTSTDATIRKGVAQVCARRLASTANTIAAREVVLEYANDADEDVRQAIADVALALRGLALRAFEPELTALVDSPTFPHMVSQLLITLDQARDRVDGLIIKCARRFVDIHSEEDGYFASGGYADARQVGELLLRAYAQASTTEGRVMSLDLIDSMLMSGAYGMSELIEATDR